MGRVPKNTLRESKKRLPLTPLGTSPSLPLDGLDGLLAGWLAAWLDKHVRALRKRPETQCILGLASALALLMLDWLQQTIPKRSQGWAQAMEASAALVLCCVCMCLRGRGGTGGGRRLVSCHSARSPHCGEGRDGGVLFFPLSFIIRYYSFALAWARVGGKLAGLVIRLVACASDGEGGVCSSLLDNNTSFLSFFPSSSPPPPSIRRFNLVLLLPLSFSRFLLLCWFPGTECFFLSFLASFKAAYSHRK